MTLVDLALLFTFGLGAAFLAVANVTFPVLLVIGAVNHRWMAGNGYVIDYPGQPLSRIISYLAFFALMLPAGLAFAQYLAEVLSGNSRKP